MLHHVWGLLAHPRQEWREIYGEEETVTQMYMRHVLILAAVPVICAFIGTTTVGWHFGGNERIPLTAVSALQLAVVFYLAIIGAVGLMGYVIYRMAKRYTSPPGIKRCIIFAGYVATPIMLAGIVALYPLIWLCLLAGIIGLCYSAWLLYLGVPGFLDITRGESFYVSSLTFAIGVLVLEALLAVTVLLWGYGTHLV
ncbi:Yip1 family protein [Kushneria aurantia]|uniref:Yip1 family protein n=1 Tax=Kushneria aurantia TaxID=504092 RepID=A0ABV6G635_9GAMM|nr:Yip1 family protein [Kushneria aurantia]